MKPFCAFARQLMMLFLVAFIVGPDNLQAQDAYNLPAAQQGAAYEFKIQTEGGLAPLKWRVSSGALPPGVELLADGTLKGTPTAARVQAYEFTLEVSDSSPSPQVFAQKFSLLIKAAPLRMVPGGKPLKIVPSSPGARKDSGQWMNVGELPPIIDDAGSANDRVEDQDKVRNKPQTEEKTSPAAIGSGAPAPAGAAQSKKKSSRATIDPAKFIRVIEHTKKQNKILLYGPGRREGEEGKFARQFTADFESDLVVEPVPERIGSDVAFDRLYMSLVRVDGNSAARQEISGYALVGKDESKTDAQKGMSFLTTATLQNAMLNMANTAKDIIHTVYDVPEYAEVDFRSPRVREKEEKLHASVNAIGKELTEEQRTALQPGNKVLERLQERLRLHQPEITKLGELLQSPNAAGVLDLLGSEIFWIEPGSLRAIVDQIQADLDTAFGSTAKDDARGKALLELLERTKLLYDDFRDARAEVRDLVTNRQFSQPEIDAAEARSPEQAAELREFNQQRARVKQLQTEVRSGNQDKVVELKTAYRLLHTKAIDIYVRRRAERAAEALRKHFIPGSISLPAAKAEDGTRFTLTIEARSSDGTQVGSQAVFDIVTKNFGFKVFHSESFLFIHRQGVTQLEANPPTTTTCTPVAPATTCTPPAGPPVIRRVNFAPSPGVTLGFNYFKRGYRGRDKFLRTLGPGAGINVSLMNFNDPDFDLTTNQFTKTTGLNVQVGAGFDLTLFHNNVHFVYGWNLNVDRRRGYFGLGFDFIKFGQGIAKYFKQ